jgi:hypothetical protein
VKAQHRQYLLIPLLLACALLSCGRGQTRDQADFWQEALPEPIAVLDPWQSQPTSSRVTAEDWTARIVEIAAFVEGPADATGATQTLQLRDAATAERHLHLRLAPGVVLPLFRNETVKIRTFSRLSEAGAVQRNMIVLARRPLGTGADFKPVVIVWRYDDPSLMEALPKALTGITRTEQVTYREARKGEGECTLATSHYMVNAGMDARAPAAPGRRRPTYPPGGRLRRQDHDGVYDVAIHDARRTSVAPCPVPDETVLEWSATWVEEEAAKLPSKPQAAAVEAVLLPQTVTPTALVPVQHPRKPRKAHEPPVHEHLPQHEHAPPVDRQGPHP